MIFVLAIGVIAVLVLFLGVKASLQAQEPPAASCDNSEKIAQILQTQATILQEITSIKATLSAMQVQTNKL
jgi:hypothetical protein